MKTDTKLKILDYLAKNGRVSPKQIIDYLGFTPAAVFRHLQKLQEQGVIQKQGKPPKVFYSLQESQSALEQYHISSQEEKLLNDQFLKITTDGLLVTGKEAFIRWALSRNLDPVKTAHDYVEVWKKFSKYKRDGVIDGTEKYLRTFSEAYLDKLYYIDFYSIERFGKTRLGELVLYAKQSQNQRLISMVVDTVKGVIEDLIAKYDVEAVGYIPATVKREVQFMKALERGLNLTKPILEITKIKTPIIVPQKTLSKLEERMENAHKSIVVEQKVPYKNILLIDDAVGSGATIHEVAKQIKDKGLCSGKLIGLGLTGSFSGFEVIGEV